MHRLFVAIRPPTPVIDALVDTMEGLDAARWQSDEQLHLTLRFIGEVDRHRAEDVATALAALPIRPVEVEIAGVGHFERKGRAHAVWARVVPSPALIELQQGVERACQRAGLEAEHRKFVAHVTLARLNASSGAVGPWLTRHADLRIAPFLAEHIVLCESHMGRSGSIYEDIACFPT